MMTKSIRKAITPARQHALEQLRVGHRIVGVRLELDRHADPPRFAVGHGQVSLPITSSRIAPADGEVDCLARQRHGRICGHCSRAESRSMTVTIADIEAARRVIAGQVLRTPMLPAPRAVGADRRRGLRQIRKPPGHQLVQGARRAQQARLADRRPSARAASSPCRPATTRRRSPITRRGSASRPPS